MADIQEWLKTLTLLVGVISVSVAICLSLKEYRLKLRAEVRLSESTTAETDIRLLQLFTELLYIASGRKGDAVYSKEILDLLIQKNLLTDKDFENSDSLKSKISTATLIAQTPGRESAAAAIASIVTLAKKHPVLGEAALKALESAMEWKPELREEYLDLKTHVDSIRE